MDAVIDAYLRSGNAVYSRLFDQWYESIKKKANGSYFNDFYDDEEWVCLTMLRLYECTKAQKYLDTTQALWDDIKQAWNTNYGSGGMAWRFAVIGTDADIAENQMEVVLAGKCELDDTSWIKPGKVNWDWWNHWTVWNVDFETGINNPTYKHIIDVASKFGVEYILLDEGWNKRVQDPFTTRDEINVKELVEYGAKKNVGIIQNARLLCPCQWWGAGIPRPSILQLSCRQAHEGGGCCGIVASRW